MGASHLLELDGPSCMALGVVSSMDVLPCGSNNGCHLFGHVGTVWVHWHGRGSHSVTVLLLGVPWWVEQMEVTEDDHPNKTW